MGESLAAIYPLELRCQSQEAMLKAELEEASRMAPPPTEEPEKKMKCPVNCVCEVRGQEESERRCLISRASAPSHKYSHTRFESF